MPDSAMTRPGTALPAAAAPPGPDLGRMLRTLLGRAHWLALMALLGALLGHDAQVALAPKYTSSVALLLDPRRPGSFGAESEFANLYVDNAKIASVAAIMKSANLLGRVVDAQRLADDPGFGAAPASAPRRWLHDLAFLHLPPLQPDPPGLRRLIALAVLTRAVQVARDGLTYVVVVTVTAPGAEQARILAQAVAEAYLDDQAQAKSLATERDHAWLTARVAAVSGELLANEQAVDAVRRRFGLAETDHAPGATVEQQAVTDVNAELQRAETEVAALRARYEQAERIRRAGGDLQGLPDMAASPLVQELRKQESAARRHLADLTSRLTAANPEVVQGERDLRAIQAQLAAEATRVMGNLRHEYEAAQARRKALGARLAALTSAGPDVAGNDGRALLRQAQRTVAANQTMYDALLAKLREVEQQQTRSDPEARVISPAATPDQPSFPKPAVFLGGGAALGLLTGGALAFVLPVRRRGFADAGAAERGLALPVLGALPRLPRRLLRRRGDVSAVIRHVQGDPLSQYSECLRALRAGLAVAGGPGMRVVQVTSARVGEGKTTIAASLAVSAALSGMRTALVDLDIRHATLARTLDLQAITDGGAPDGLVRAHLDIPLTLVDAGVATGLRPELIASPHFAEVIRAVARGHDLVILDNPPVLAVSDPMVIAQLADATLLVVEALATPQPLVEQAIRALRAARAPLAGIVLNKVRLSTVAQYGYGFGVYRQDVWRNRQIAARRGAP